jgi:hypothetical protein
MRDVRIPFEGYPAVTSLYGMLGFTRYLIGRKAVLVTKNNVLPPLSL